MLPPPDWMEQRPSHTRRMQRVSAARVWRPMSPDVAVAAQLADFMTPRLDRGSGMMALPDMYCLFNRARGAELISPDDLLSAAKLFPAIGARLSFRQFPSGVLVVQSSAHLDDQVSRSCNHSVLLRALTLSPESAVIQTIYHGDSHLQHHSFSTAAEWLCGMRTGVCQDC